MSWPCLTVSNLLHWVTDRSKPTQSHMVNSIITVLVLYKITRLMTPPFSLYCTLTVIFFQTSSFLFRIFLPHFNFPVLWFVTLSDCLVIFILIFFQLKQLLYFSAFINIHIFAIYLNRNIYVHTFENKDIYLFFSIARALMLSSTAAKLLEQLFLFFLERSLLMD